MEGVLFNNLQELRTYSRFNDTFSRVFTVSISSYFADGTDFHAQIANIWLNLLQVRAQLEQASNTKTILLYLSDEPLYHQNHKLSRPCCG